jgi:hypothetical protein
VVRRADTRQSRFHFIGVLAATGGTIATGAVIKSEDCFVSS